MRHLIHSIVALSALALPILAHADTFAGSVSFADLGPTNNNVSFTGDFDHSSFNFSGQKGATYTDAITLISHDSNLRNTTQSDNLQISIHFTLPSSAAGSITGTGAVQDTLTFLGYFDHDTLVWNNGGTQVFNFADGSQITASIGNFDFNGYQGNSVSDCNDLTLKVTQNPVPEPSSLALLGTGILGAAGALRRRLLA